MLWKVFVVLSLANVVISDLQIALISGRFVKNLRSEWKYILAHTIRQIEYRLPVNILSFKYTTPAWKTSTRDWAGYIMVAQCDETNKIESQIPRNSQKLPLLRLDLDDCSFNNTVPVIWTKTMPHCFEAGVEYWLTQVKDRTLRKKSLISSATTFWDDRKCRGVKEQIPRSTFATAVEFSRQRLRGRTIQAVGINFAPGMIVVRNAQGEITGCAGATAEALNMVAEKENFNYICMSAPENTFGSLINKTYYNGALGVVARRQADFSLAAASYSYERYQGVDFVFPMADTWTSMLMPIPQKQTQLWAAFRSFTFDVWVLIIASMTIIGVLIWLASYLRYTPRGSVALGTVLTDLFGVLCGQGSEARLMLEERRYSLRILMGSWFLGTVVIVYTYTSTMVSFLSVPLYRPIVDSIEELAQKNPVKLVIIRGLAHQELLMSAESGNYKILGDRLREDPDSLVSGLSEGVQRVLAGTSVLFASEPSVQTVIKQDYQKAGLCRMSMGKERIFGLLTSFHVQKGSLYWPALSDRVGRMASAGITDKFARDIQVKSACTTMQKSLTKTKSLSLLDLLSAFVVYSIGIAIAVICLVLELILLKIKYF